MANYTILAFGAVGALAATTAAVTVVPTATTTTTTTTAAAAPAVVTDADAARLAKQATFGPTPAVIARIKKLGIQGWLDEQFALKTSSFEDLTKMSVANSYCDTQQKGNANCFRVYRDSVLPAMRFYKDAVNGDDQLRQRVALALFNIMPVSSLKTTHTSGLARYQQILLDNAFGNFSDVLRNVIISGAMGKYLDLADSNKSAPNENLSRELMQLFSLGPNAIHANGVARVDAAGVLQQNYTNKDVTELARALTGWTYTRLPGYGANATGVYDLAKPLIVNAAAFDTGAKTFLGTTIPAGATPAANVDTVIKRVMSDPSTSPRITTLLIQALVKSNPTPAYISRASKVFRNNGSGVVGDLRAVVRAILTDTEARTRDTTARGGKLKDPILLATALGRLTGMTTDGYAFTVRDVQMGQQFLRGPSIFGDYPSDYPLAGDRHGWFNPSSKLLTVATVHERTNFVWQWTMSGDTVRPEFTTPAWVPTRSSTVEDWSSWEAFGSDVDGMIDRINLLMLDNSMTAAQRASLKTAMTLVTDPSPALQARRRAQTGLYIVASSPQFQIDR